MRRALRCASILPIVLSACNGVGAFDSVGPGRGSDDPSSFGPTEPAPTGTAWKTVETVDACGRATVGFVLVDEMCGDGDGNPNLSTLHAPMFRDGAVVGQHLYAIDATHLWGIDISNTEKLERKSLLTGLGQPLAMALHGTDLVLASGDEGLVEVSTIDPAAPKRTRRTTLPDNAIDVQVVGDDAYVALGKAGIAQVSLRDGSSQTRTIPLSGFSAGVAVRGERAYVAACSSFKVVDLKSGSVLSETWVPNARLNGRLVAPAKRVTLVDQTAFVAAGVYGAVAIDISNDKAANVLGNCTKLESSFYASGVRTSKKSLAIAGGEWGVLQVDLSDPKTACQGALQAKVPEAIAGSPSSANLDKCDQKPPWETVSWQTIWKPPPPARDPIQVLYNEAGNHVYAFGDARRVGVRAVDIHDATNHTLPLIGRYDEPRKLVDIAIADKRVAVAGPHGGVYQIDEALGLALSQEPADVAARKTFLGSERVVFANKKWVTLDGGKLYIEGEANPRPVVLKGDDGDTPLAANGNFVVLPTAAGIEKIDTTSPTAVRAVIRPSASAHLPMSIAYGAFVYYASPEWTESYSFGSVEKKLDAHGVFDTKDANNATLWRVRLPRRVLLQTPVGLAEVAVLGLEAGFVLNKQKLSLPPMQYVAGATDGTHAYFIGIDRSLYKSYVVGVDFSGATPKLIGTSAFTGGATGIAATQTAIYVTDAEGVVRIYGIKPTTGELADPRVVTLSAPEAP